MGIIWGSKDPNWCPQIKIPSPIIDCKNFIETINNKFKDLLNENKIKIFQCNRLNLHWKATRKGENDTWNKEKNSFSSASTGGKTYNHYPKYSKLQA